MAKYEPSTNVELAHVELFLDQLILTL